MSPLLILLACLGAGEDSSLKIDAAKVVNRITPWMYGSCIEDVNHEIYGGLYAQMIFGESFEEPSAASPVQGWARYDGAWTPEPGQLRVKAAAGAKLVREVPPFADGTVTVDVRVDDAAA